MTKEKLAIKLAIDIMERNVSKYINHGIYEVSDTDGAVHVEFAEAINILNGMLEQQPCEDAVSRQTVIDSIRNYFHDEYYQRTSIQDCRDCLIEDVIKSLPPVTPIRPKDDVLEKIRAEIEQYQSDAFYSDDVMLNKRTVLKIIDKYKADKRGAKDEDTN